jgi:DnaJ family protein C protein 2
LSHLRHLAPEDQIHKSYLELALKFHPDKQAYLLSEKTEATKEAKNDEIETRFMAIRKAYEVLINLINVCKPLLIT